MREDNNTKTTEEVTAADDSVTVTDGALDTDATPNETREIGGAIQATDADGAQADGYLSEYIPKNKTERAMLAVYKNDELTASLKITSMAIVVLTVYALLYDIVLALSTNDYYHIIAVLVTTGVPFVIVSVMRKVLNAKRPYELLPFYKTPPKAKSGQSFPSRHVFSVFVIGSVLCAGNLTVGLLLILAGALLSAVRVLLGYHFIKDVVAGAVIGVISGIGGALIFGLFA